MLSFHPKGELQIYMAHTDLFPPLDERLGFNMTIQSSNVLSKYDLSLLNANPGKLWYHDFSVPATPNSSPYQYMMASSWQGNPVTSGNISAWTAKAIAYPGRKWLFMNEPDVYGQARRTPQEYAEEYHWFYYAMKAADSTCKIYAGGITQASPQRIRWMQEMLDHYETTYSETLPCDGFHIHTYLMPEAFGPGVGEAYGVSNPTSDPNVTSIQENDDWWWSNASLKDVNILRDYLMNFRIWMKDNGYENKPVIVSEHTVLLYMSPAYLVPYMNDSLTLFLNGKDITYGCPLDDYRLVQEFAFFCINYKTSVDVYPHTWLYNFYSPYNITDIGLAYRAWYEENFPGHFLQLPEGNFLLLPNNVNSRLEMPS